MTINVKSSAWHEGAYLWLLEACNQYIHILDLKDAVENNRATLFDIIKDGEHCGSFVVAVEDGANKEIVVLAAGGFMPGDGAYKKMTAFVEALAIQHRAKYIRGHTLKPAVGRMMEAAGFKEQVEIIYRKKVDYGRR